MVKTENHEWLFWQEEHLASTLAFVPWPHFTGIYQPVVLCWYGGNLKWNPWVCSLFDFREVSGRMKRQCHLICKAESAESVDEEGAGWDSAWQREESSDTCARSACSEGLWTASDKIYICVSSSWAWLQTEVKTREACIDYIFLNVKQRIWICSLSMFKERIVK